MLRTFDKWERTTRQCKDVMVWGRDELSPILSIFIACAGHYLRWAMKMVPASDHSFVINLYFFITRFFPSYLTEETKCESENCASHWATTGGEPCTVGHCVYAVNERMMQLEGCAASAASALWIFVTVHQSVPVRKTSVRFICPFSVYAVNC